MEISLLIILAIVFELVGCVPAIPGVKVFHYILHHWGTLLQGEIPCPGLQCQWQSSDHVKHLKHSLESTVLLSGKSKTPHFNNRSITLAVYNVHSLWEKHREHKPIACELRTDLNMVESEESRIRYGWLFDASFKNFDGFSTTHPSSSVQRVYSEAFLNETSFLKPFNFTELISGASYVASDCHKRDSANSNRDFVVQSLRDAGVRVDGLGRCMKSPTGPEGVVLTNSKDSKLNLAMKRETISRYKFHLAFENSIEDGYVTEKPFDALIAGTVPVYLGDSVHLKSLLPSPNAAIFADDFHGNYTALGQYLLFLSQNSTAFEEHRNWRNRYIAGSRASTSPLLAESWACRVCRWAASAERKKSQHKCDHVQDVVTAGTLEGKPVRGNDRVVYLVQNGTLHSIPNLATFFALNLQLSDVVQISEYDIKRFGVSDSLKDVSKS